MIVSPTQEQSDLLFMKIRLFIESSEFLMQHVKQFKSDRCELLNGTIIKSLPVGNTGATIRGHSADLIILEESPYIKDVIVHEVVMPMGAASKKLKIIQIGTPKGRNHFFEVASNPVFGYRVFKYDYTYAVNAGLQSIEYINAQREMLTKEQFNAEYCAEFMDGQGNYFSINLINSCLYDIPQLGGV